MFREIPKKAANGLVTLVLLLVLLTLGAQRLVVAIRY